MYRSRRSFLQGMIAAASLWPSRLRRVCFASDALSLPIRQIHFDLYNAHKWNDSNGDTWDPFWADDDNLYSFNCDGRGFGQHGRNLAFNCLRGSSMASLQGSQVNSMDEYGKGAEKGPDNATWKVCGQECMDGIFYAFVSRNTYGSDSGDAMLRQTAHDCSLIKSTDRGVSWMRSARENYRNPMWPGPHFGAPFFIHYGKDGGIVTRDQANEFVYAVSTNGFWNDGDSYTLGRVKRHRLAELQVDSWSYYMGGDGSLERNWSDRLENATPILARPLKCGQGPICYIPALQRYLMISWYNTEKMTKWFEPNRMRYDFYQAEHPWGPWEFIDSHSDDFLTAGHMYGPSLCAKFQRSEDAEVHLSMLTSGCPFDDVPSGLYKMWEIPLILRTKAAWPTTVVLGDDPRIKYSGAWHSASLHTRYTSTPNSSATLKFEGTGIAYLTDVGPELGEFEIHLDDRLVKRGNLRKDNFPEMVSVEAYAQDGLERGSHTICVTSTGHARVAIESFRIVI